MAKKQRILRQSAVGVFLAISLVGYLATDSPSAGGPPWYGIVPPLLAVTMALITGRMLLSLTAAVVVGGMLSLWRQSAGAFGSAGWIESLPQGSGAFGSAGWIESLPQGSGAFGSAGWVESLPQGSGAFESAGWIKSLALGSGAGFAWESISDKTNLLILAHVVLIMAMISVMIKSGGLQGVAAWLARYARGRRSTKLVTMAAGLVIFIDDYANTMIVGSALRPVTDRQQISREKLAFLVDATAAPVAGIAVVSTWIGYEVGLLGSIAAQLEVAKDGYAMFFDALGFRYYCLGMIGFVLWNSLSDCDFGPMAAAERRARDEGKLLADGQRPMTSQSMASAEPYAEARVFASVAMVPLAVLLTAFVGMLWFDGGGTALMSENAMSVFHLSAWREVFSAAQSIPLLARAAGIGCLTAVVLAVAMAKVPISVVGRAIGMGVSASLMPLAVLVLAWSLKGACDALDTGEFLAGVLAGKVPPALFPGMVFVVAGLTAFATGTSWGTMAILIPTAIPVAFRLDGGVYGLITMMSVAAVLDGSVFGDHCSPISDTTIMSSTASACHHMAHVRTQIPYSLAVALFALATGYLPSALGAPKWMGISGVVGVSGLLFLGLWSWARFSGGTRSEA
jgi:Na+/H+ antiporter NhaC